ncbi:MAG: hypothetical protein AAFR42_17780 [Cyanobacteria bacterium J06628_6]
MITAAVRAAIAPLLCLCLWLMPGAIAVAAPLILPIAITPPESAAAAETTRDPEADLADIFSPIAEAFTTTESALATDAADTSLIEALASVSEAADQQALTQEPETIEDSVQNWLTSVRSFLDLQ